MATSASSGDSLLHRLPAEKADLVRAAARVGYAAKGVVYLLIGALALMLVFGVGGEIVGAGGAFEHLAGKTWGSAVLIVLAIGLLCYSLWRWFQAAADPERKGNDAKGIATRFGYVCSGIVYAGFAVKALALVIGAASGSTDSATKWTARLMELPFGRYLAGAVAIGIAIAGVYQLVRGWKAKFMDELRTGEMSERQRTMAYWAGRAGFIARGVVYGIIAFLLMKAAIDYDPEKAAGVGEALVTLRDQTPGQIALAVVAAGLFLYGAFALFVLAPYRRVIAEGIA